MFFFFKLFFLKKQACLKRALNLFLAPRDEFRVQPPKQDPTEQSQPRQTRQTASKSGGSETGERSKASLEPVATTDDRGEETRPSKA